MFQFDYEHRSAPSVGLLALDGLANPLHCMEVAGDAHNFVDRVTIYTDANPEMQPKSLTRYKHQTSTSTTEESPA